MAQLMTVLGPVDSDDLGMTLTHEHLFIDQMREARSEGLLNDERLMRQEVRHYQAAGGRTLVDCTSIGLGRDVSALRRLSQATGLNIIAGTGFYRHPYLDTDWFDRTSVDAIADLIVQEIEEGIDGIGTRPGVIGEIGCDRYISAAEERSFRAAARAHRRTGLTITTHAARWPVGGPQLDLLEEEGVAPGRIIIGHCDRVVDESYHEMLALRGAWVQFDTIRPLSEYDLDIRVGFVKNMAGKGLLGQVLLSQDICMRGHLHAYGGAGYDFVVTTFLQRLRDAGITSQQIHMLFVDNPRRALTGEP